MTATHPIVESVVTVEHDGNLAIVTWHRIEPPRPPVHFEPLAGGRSGEEAASARRVNFRGAWRRCQLRRDLTERGSGLLIGVVAAAVLLALFGEHITRYLTGGH